MGLVLKAILVLLFILRIRDVYEKEMLVKNIFICRLRREEQSLLLDVPFPLSPLPGFQIITTLVEDLMVQQQAPISLGEMGRKETHMSLINQSIYITLPGYNTLVSLRTKSLISSLKEI